ncbi:MAG: hypothetical protein JXA57_20105 [Armatimonadetes bacterium]|nr:hypothetical protein [Armatimonadota bacterium]
MFSAVTGSLIAYYVGIAIVALPGLIGVLLVGRMHRAAIEDCHRLREEVSRVEEASGRVRSLLTDVVATMNMSLAFCAANPGTVPPEKLEEIRAAVEQAVRSHQHAGLKAE